MIQLNNRQITFIQYIIDEHNSVGYVHSLSLILTKGSYNLKQRAILQKVVEIFNGLLNELRTTIPHDEWNTIKRFSVPFKYLR